MKKTTYLLGLFFTVCTYSFAQYTPVPDDNFEQALINAGIDSNSTLDNQVLTSEANAFTGTLSITNLGISDLTGVEALTNMTEFVFNYNTGITSVDLSSCTALTNVSALGCTGLTTIDVTGLLNLTVLNLRNSSLTSLDVTSNISLENLNVRNCFISNLDLSLNTSLTVVDAKNNSLVLLDMRNGNNVNVTSFNADFNGCLKCIYVDDASSPLIPPVWVKGNSSSYVETEGECDLLPEIPQSECPTMGISEVSDISFNMYPNPANNTLHVTTRNNNAVVNIYNITGKVILNKTLAQGRNLIDVSSLASGIYLARFVSDNKVDTKKLIIK